MIRNSYMATCSDKVRIGIRWIFVIALLVFFVCVFLFLHLLHLRNYIYRYLRIFIDVFADMLYR